MAKKPEVSDVLGIIKNKIKWTASLFLQNYWKAYNKRIFNKFNLQHV